MAGSRLLIVKLGGSVITFKDRPMTLNSEAVEQLAESIRYVSRPLVVVHGGGSFGHHIARSYGLGNVLKKIDPIGVAKTREAMLRLNLMILEKMIAKGLSPYSLPPAVFFEGESFNPRIQLIDSLLDNGLIPITFGDVIILPDGCRIVSGDTLVRMLTEALMPESVIFTIDVDGVFTSMNENGRLIRELDHQTLSDIIFRYNSHDVTGGIYFKLKEALKISELGVNVLLVNGLKPNVVVKALKGEEMEGTLIRGVKGVGCRV